MGSILLRVFSYQEYRRLYNLISGRTVWRALVYRFVDVLYCILAPRVVGSWVDMYQYIGRGYLSIT